MNFPLPSVSASSGCDASAGCRCRCCRRSVSWPAILAGLATALALQVLFMFAGAGLGFALYSPLTEENPVMDLGHGAMVVQGLSAVLSLWLGGWVAGRFTPRGLRATGGLHGFVVWCSATIVGVLFVSAGAGWALGDLAKLAGGGLALAGRPAAAAVGGTADLAKDAAKQTGDTLGSFTDEALGVRPGEAARDDSIRAKREIGLALARLFNPMQIANRDANRTAVLKALTQYTGRTEAEANRLLTEWTATYDQLKADLLAAREAAERKARETADQAAHALAIFSLCAFAGFLLGAFAAAYGGCHGAKCARRCDERADADLDWADEPGATTYPREGPPQ